MLCHCNLFNFIHCSAVMGFDLSWFTFLSFILVFGSISSIWIFLKFSSFGWVFFPQRGLVVLSEYWIQLKIFFYFTDRVNHKPIITDPPQNSTIVIGTSITFKCFIISDLHLSVQWAFNLSNCKNCSNQTMLQVMVQISKKYLSECMQSNAYPHLLIVILMKWTP